jgi:hypothetical protein
MTASKIVLNAASGVGGAGPDVNEVFSTYLYTGNNTANRVINNGIDLAGEGGMVWTKIRYPAGDHNLWTTDIGAGYRLIPNGTNSKITDNGLTSFNNNGFTIQDNSSTNPNNNDMASWTFRKAPKFFDVVTWTGNSTAGRTVSHDLGTDVGFIAIKCTSASGDWMSWHRSASSYAGRVLKLNATDGATNNSSIFNSTNPTSTEFTLGSSYDVNGSGATYVAYLFAHNNGDGEFGPDGDADIIKCGSYTGNGSSSGVEVDLGFEPQWVLIKSATQGSTNWTITDTMRGWTVGNGQNYVYPNSNSAELSTTTNLIDPLPDGFKVFGSGSNYNTSGQTYIYMAIRRGPMAVPESGTEVFDVSVTDYSANQTIAANIDVTDTFMVGHQPTNNNSNGLYLFSRLTGNKRLRTDQTFSENAELGLSGFDTQNGVVAGSSDSGQNVWNASFPFIKYFMKRAPNFFDVVAYTGNATAGRDIPHNLGVTPEMIWVKKRSSATDSDWAVYHTGLAQPYYYIRLNLSNTFLSDPQAFDSGNHTATTFSVGLNARTNGSSGEDYIAYLFASLNGISKVGSVTHSGSSTDVDCGFASGARFVLLKRTDATGDWYFWDTTRGIVSGNDPYLTLNGTNQPEVTNTDYIDPLSSGFQISGDFTDGTYIFYAIA